MKGLDTNVILRYLVQDDPTQAKLATQFIERECTEDSPCLIGHVTLCEMAWVLEEHYAQGRDDIANIIEHLLQIGQLEITQADTVWRALHDYRNSNADFPDHLIARANQANGAEVTVTFNKKAGKQPEFKLLSP